MGTMRFLLDGRAHSSDTRRVRHGQVVAIVHRDLTDDVDLATGMQRECAVLPFEELDVGDGANGLDHTILMGLTRAVDDDVLIE